MNKINTLILAGSFALMTCVTYAASNHDNDPAVKAPSDQTQSQLDANKARETCATDGKQGGTAKACTKDWEPNQKPSATKGAQPASLSDSIDTN